MKRTPSTTIVRISRFSRGWHCTSFKKKFWMHNLIELKLELTRILKIEVTFLVRLLYRKGINQKLLMNCDPNLCTGENSTMISLSSQELVKIRTKLAVSNLKKSQTTMFTLLLHRSITLLSHRIFQHFREIFKCQFSVSATT